MSIITQKHRMHLVVVALVSAALGASIFSLFQTPSESSSAENVIDDNKPLYWVAPMDANYRRDKPGKSPMGMDLVPVYADSEKTGDVSPGTIEISPEVVNNLGVRTATVELGTLPSEITTVGYVQYDEDQLLHIHPRVDGWIEELFVKAAGNPVEKGQPLYTLYSPQLVNAQEELVIAVKRNNQSLIAAARERLFALQLSDVFVAELEKTLKVQQNITFYSPQSGVVDGLKIREGFFVQPGTTLMSIGKLDQVWVEAEVFERDSALIKNDLPVSMTLDYLPGQQWQGVVDYVYPTLNSTTRTLRVRLKFDNPDYQLKPNMFAQVVIYGHQDTKTILVPKESVIRTGKQDRVVLSLGDGKFKSVEVLIGRVGQQRMEILEGLSTDDVIVTSAQFLIDSESSKTSDFKRMSQAELPGAVWMAGVVQHVMTDEGAVNITHEAVDAWGWPEMTMDFMVSESLNIGRFKTGQELHFEVTRQENGSYTITNIHIMSEPEVPSASVTGTIDAMMPNARTFTISRGPIEKWNRPAMTMDFVLADNIDINRFNVGDKVLFTFEIRDEFVITEMRLEDQHEHHQHHQQHQHKHHQHHQHPQSEGPKTMGRDTSHMNHMSDSTE